MSLSIRASVFGDEQTLAALNRFAQEIHLANRPDTFKPSILDDVAEWFSLVLQNPASRVWIAEEAERAVGYVLTMVHERPENPFCHARRWCEIDQIAVDPRFRRRGVASALIQKAVAAADTDGIHDVEISTWSFNEEAQRAFRKLGFVPKVVRWELPTDPL